jgi:hypothetical protein
VESQTRPTIEAKETSQTRQDSGLALEEQHYNLLLSQWTEAIIKAYFYDGTPPDTLGALPVLASPPVRSVSLERPGSTVETVELLETEALSAQVCQY